MLTIGVQIFFETLLFILLFFNVFVLKTSNLIWVILELFSFLIVLFCFIKFKYPTKNRDNTPYYIIIGGCLLTQGIFCIFGLFNGFTENYNAIYKNYLTKSYILFAIIIVVLTEIIRHVITTNLKHTNRDKKYYLAKVIMILNYIFIDYLILGTTCNFTSNYEMFNLLMVFVIPTATKHLLLDYTNQKYGYKINLGYRLIMDLSMYFIPTNPKINIFLKTVVISILPYCMYIALEKIDKKAKREVRSKKKNVNVNVVSFIILVVLVYLVSCQFTYSMIAVGSESMQGTIDKGDAVIYKAYKKEKLKEGEIIVFQQNNRIVVHRISSIIESDDGGQAYITKGDANLTEDNWIVTQNNVVGVVKLRVLLIAWPSVLLNEWL